MCGTLTAVYDSAVGGLREQRTLITLLFPFHTHTDLQLQHQCVAETKRTENIITITVYRLFREERGGERDI